MRCPALRELVASVPSKSGWPWTQETPQVADALATDSPLPRISIVTPSYNQGRFLEETIRSVLLQGYPDLEYVVMDGGSKDNSVDIIKHYAPWLASWCSEKDNGQADAIRRGFELSTGGILAWLNSDDLLCPGALQKVSRYFVAHPEVDCVVGGAIVIDETDRIINDRLGLPRVVRGARETFNSMLVRSGCSFYQPASFWRRKSYFAVGGVDATLIYAMDYDLYLKLALQKQFGHLSSILACFRIHAESKTTLLTAVRQREMAELTGRYGEHQISAFHRFLYRSYLATANVVQNVPFRLGVKTGFVRLPYTVDKGAKVLVGRL